MGTLKSKVTTKVHVKSFTKCEPEETLKKTPLEAEETEPFTQEVELES